MRSDASTVPAYLASLPADRRAVVETVRAVIRDNLDDGYEEGMQYGMIGYHVPLRLYPAGYLGDASQPLPFAALSSQKRHLSLYLMGVYCGCTDGPEGETADARWFREAWARTGKKLDMGKACLRFTGVEQLALDVIGEAIRRVPARIYVERYQAARGERDGVTKSKARTKAKAKSAAR